MKNLFISISLILFPAFASAQQNDGYYMMDMMGVSGPAMLGWGFLWFIFVSFIFSLIFWLVYRWIGGRKQ